MGSFDFVTVFFFVAAVIIFLQLRNVLGRRTGNERQPFDPYSARDGENLAGDDDDSKVITLPRRDGDRSADDRFAAADAYCDAGTDLNTALRSVISADPEFDPREFVAGAKTAYEMIVDAYAEGDKKALKQLLSKEVYEGFVSAIKDRDSRSETIKSSFVGIGKADIVQAEMKGSEANVTMRISSQLITATYDKDGNVVDGDPDSVGEVNDVWTFARDTRSRDPNWKLIATESED
ncbi:Tim44/TimA family putative adaptor protein [Hoeflea prorocentri]|uniref:Tim44/TimA family putative adaptor protein n=1 Tax=Hoeflea prorocentri TaxID=1922333 RepID=A0A9X3ZJJ3_9HYPH|nr:Tim44/TimA family putative adaptor protein [Hoeflea prorocentri]MCY6383158.1 Tim44/TimA family putative adaptor protein [Hoeflea prorocentri]MDA5400958.1 Tim44/TimA family putative adaptor protein [Hoeflea prorocentri]